MGFFFADSPSLSESNDSVDVDYYSTPEADVEGHNSGQEAISHGDSPIELDQVNDSLLSRHNSSSDSVQDLDESFSADHSFSDLAEVIVEESGILSPNDSLEWSPVSSGVRQGSSGSESPDE